MPQMARTLLPLFSGANNGVWAFVLRRVISDPTTITIGKPGDVFDDYGEIYVNGVRVSSPVLAYTGNLNASQVMQTTVNPGDIVEIRLTNRGSTGGFQVAFSDPGLIPGADFANTFVEGKAAHQTWWIPTAISLIQAKTTLQNCRSRSANLKDGAA